MTALEAGESAADEGSVADSGQTLTLKGRIMPEADADWFKVTAAPNKHLCTDQTAAYLVKVYLKPNFSGVLPCTGYEVKVSNGVYKTE